MGRNSAPVRALLRQLLSGKHDPESIARGAGLGVSIAFLPIIGLQMVAAIVLASILRANRIAAVVGTLLSNPLTAMPQAALAIWLGSFFSAEGPIEFEETFQNGARDLLHLSGELLNDYLIGTLLLSIVGGVVAYFSVRLALCIWHSRPEAKRQRSSEKSPSHQPSI